MLIAMDRLYYCLDVFSMNSDLLEGAERMATATRLESPTFVHLTRIEVDRTALRAANQATRPSRLHSDVSGTADVSTAPPIGRSSWLTAATGLAAAAAANHRRRADSVRETRAAGAIA
jgi:hypothetical protein